jgi:hypothetical protein
VAPAPAFGLIHRPLVGPLTWGPVAGALAARGARAVVPDLHATPATAPYWAAHAATAAAPLAGMAGPLFLVGHSGAGALLPAIRQALGRPVAGYIFVDADPQQDGRSRLARFADPAAAAAFRDAAVDGSLPMWTAGDLQEEIPDPALRARFVAELRPCPLAVYEEELPVFPGWPDAPVAYLQFSAPYDPGAQHARAAGWRYRSMPAGHFHMLVDPDSVAAALLDLAARLASAP